MSLLLEGGIGIFGFSVSAIFRSVFRFLHLKTWFFGFDACCGLQVFPFLSIWFLVFGQNTSGFSDLVSVVVFSFLIWFWFVFGNYAPQLRALYDITRFPQKFSVVTQRRIFVNFPNLNRD